MPKLSLSFRSRARQTGPRLEHEYETVDVVQPPGFQILISEGQYSTHVIERWKPKYHFNGSTEFGPAKAMAEQSTSAVWFSPC